MTTFDFGYSWGWTHGHLVPFALFAIVAALAVWRGWSRWLQVLPALAAIWALAGFLIVQFVLDANRVPVLPTSAFLQSGSGDVLDVGAGSGRSALMVLTSRPGARVTALDIYSGYWGIDDNTPERIRANASVAGVSDRLEVRVGDMRAMPLADAAYDAALSAFALDHLDREGITRALAEVARVLRPGGEFLLININADGWLKVAYPFPHGHGGYFTRASNADRWRSALAAANFELIEEGMRPATVYFLARKPRGAR
jgi:SAM-dependent methyltransferase